MDPAPSEAATMLASASAPTASSKLVTYTDTEDIFEMTERELWGEDAGIEQTSMLHCHAVQVGLL